MLKRINGWGLLMMTSQSQWQWQTKGTFSSSKEIDQKYLESSIWAQGYSHTLFLTQNYSFLNTWRAPHGPKHRWHYVFYISLLIVKDTLHIWFPQKLPKAHCIFDSSKSCQRHIAVQPPNSWQTHICCRLKYPMLCSLSLSYELYFIWFSSCCIILWILLFYLIFILLYDHVFLVNKSFPPFR